MILVHLEMHIICKEWPLQVQLIAIDPANSSLQLSLRLDQSHGEM